MVKVIICLFAFIQCSVFLYAGPGQSAMHPKEQLDFVRKQIKTKQAPYYAAYLQLLQKADSALQVNEHAIEDFSIPGFYSNKDEHRKNSLALQIDGFSAYSCALAWQLSGKKKYAKKAVYFLHAWAEKNKKYSQLDGSLVMSYSGTTLMIAAKLMQDSKQFNTKEQAMFATWTKDVFREATNSIRYRNNNSGDWSRLSSLLADDYLNDSADFNANVKLIKKDLFEKIASDGHMVEEVKREKNGIWYTYFSLAPLTASCWVIYNQTGEDLFTAQKDSASIKKALDYLLYYNQHPQEWKYFKDPATGHTYTEVGFWPANLLEAMYGIYGEKTFDDFVATHRPILYQKHDFAWTFPTLMPLSINHYQ